MSDEVTICVCGTVSPHDARYCEGCGRLLDTHDLLDLEELQQPATTATELDSVPDRNPRWWIPLAIVLLAVAGVAGVMIATVGGGSTDEADDEAAEPTAEIADEEADEADEDVDDESDASVAEANDETEAEDGAVSVGRYEPLGDDAAY